ncbi:hypothetical protein ILUMI_15423 [Ignelater luminosus]|uniref:Uncharacterized protein n=1 Tax=Ignelater luminosus TaxID=2038154 RepID=A0A8K0CNN5_IGNLU|nr:hypothetical protein ILUMI_15423 [Ignelater luminosus]
MAYLQILNILFQLIILGSFVNPAELCEKVDSHSAICPGQNYTALPADFQRNIEDLNLAHNNITELEANELKQYPKVRNFNLNYNQIRSSNSIRAIHHLRKLERLSVSGNDMYTFDFQVLARNNYLKEIEASDNKHIFIKEKCVLLRKLERLSLNGNNMENFPSSVLKCFTNLRYLDLRNNSLHTLPSNIHEILPKLEVILLAGNPLTVGDLDAFVFSRSDLNNN